MAETGLTNGGMTADEIVDRTEEHAPLSLDEQGLRTLLEAVEVVRDDDTCLAGRIRILSHRGTAMVQEQTQKGEVLLWRLGSLEGARRFVDDRLATYERMWDGCGCKVDYGRPPENA